VCVFVCVYVYVCVRDMNAKSFSVMPLMGSRSSVCVCVFVCVRMFVCIQESEGHTGEELDRVMPLMGSRSSYLRVCMYVCV
jgi:hypothetical protein